GMAGIDQIKNAKSFCLVAQAPSVDWVVPLHRYLRLGTHWDFHHSKTAAPKYQSQQDDVTKEQTTQAIAMGGRCLGVSQQLSLLPNAMVAAADMTLVLQHPNAR